MSNEAWTQKHKPKGCHELVGQAAQAVRLKSFVTGHKTSKKKAALLYGPTGTGKTSSVYAVAKDLKYEIMEVNASDFRNADAINSTVGNAAAQLSLFAAGKIILLDEIDGVSGQKDRGGIQAITKLLGKSAHPIIMTAQEPWDKKFSALRKASEMIQYIPLKTAEVLAALQNICSKEEITAEGEALNSLANRSGGDLRAAINDLQITAGSTLKITKKDVDTLSERNRVESMIQAITKILKTTDFGTASSSLDDVQEQPEEWFLWIDENLPTEYKNPKYLAKAYEAVSKADIFNSRIKINQYWRLLVYIKMLLSAGVALAKDEKGTGSTEYRQTSRLLKIWITNSRYHKRKNIAEKIAEKTHTSTEKILKDFPYYKEILKNSNAVTEELGLDEEEIEWARR